MCLQDQVIQASTQNEVTYQQTKQTHLPYSGSVVTAAFSVDHKFNAINLTKRYLSSVFDTHRSEVAERLSYRTHLHVISATPDTSHIGRANTTCSFVTIFQFILLRLMLVKKTY
ncbi:hypothetical protein CHS0354_042435 [Potamilus streckersoni]|uniref:Uncharacterized protein n=1 Tax=Potamilus streckersoni TaxID=2493646 RepID=A0AAE0SU38_9BIVA|nr:hypothetical protein CHS0354_042435 [Potamilus streckersoni]